jgi:aminopeptidase N
VRNYINAHRYGNARTEDLWASVQAASGQPVLELARSFTNQPGFPLLTTSTSSCRRGGHTDVSIAQRRFAMDDSARTNERWSVPLVARHVSGGDPVRTLLAPGSEGSVTLACGSYLVNAGQSGFFRVKYDNTNFDLLTQRFSELESVDQLGLLLDYYAFGRSGDASFANYLDLVDVAPADADPVIVMDTASSMSAFAAYTHDRPSAEAVRAYGRRVLEPHFARVGWQPRPGDDANLTNMRATLITTLGGLGDEAVIAEARRRVRASQTDPTALPGAIRTAARSVYAANATEEDFNALLTQARAETEFVEQRRLWLLLTSVNDEALAQRILQMTLGDDIPRQIRPQVISGVAANHPRMGWDFLVANRTAIEAMLDPLQRLEFPTNIAAVSGDPAMVDELGRYAQNFPEGSARDSVAAAQAQIRIRAETIRERMPAVEAWIAEHPPRR